MSKAQAMTPDDFAKAMRAIREGSKDDLEEWHIAADELAYSLLRDLGYGDGVDACDRDRWYYA